MLAIESFQLFLFDFDGLLVDTEPLHYEAYKLALLERGAILDWDFSYYSSLAHQNAIAIRSALEKKFPEIVLDWEKFYQEKKICYQKLIEEGKISCMPGVKELLILLEKKKIESAIVTHSPKIQIEKIISKLPILQTIQHRITREDYHQPKPDPECYQKAIDLYAEKDAKVIGFEDSLRGLSALEQTRATAVWICSKEHPLFQERKKGYHFSSFSEIKWS